MTARDAGETPAPLYRSPDPVDVPGAWFDERAVDRVVKFARLCRHTKGRWAGDPIVFDDWQLEHVIRPTFGWRGDDGLRIIRTLYLEVPKKNGKTTLATVLGLYLAGADDEPGADVFAAAAAKDQARLVFDPARLMVERSPVLRRRYRPMRNAIVYGADDGTFRVVSADANVQDGLNPHGNVIDELHRHERRDLVDILEAGTGTREQPLTIIITTAGDERDDTIYAEKHDYAVQVAKGVITDPSLHACIYAAEAQDDPFAEETIRKANPGCDRTVSLRWLVGESEKAKLKPARLKTYLRLHLNVRTKLAVTQWQSVEVFDRNEIPGDERGEVLASLAGRPAYAAFDVSRTQDVNALVLDFPHDDGTHVVLYRFWLPEELVGELDESTAGNASAWAAAGDLILTPGDVVDYAAVADQLRSDGATYDLREIAFNRRGASQLASELEAEGLDLVELTTGIKLAPAMQEWERLLLTGRDRHFGNAVARYQFDGLAAKLDAEGNAWPDKGKSAVNISGMVARVMALDRDVLSEVSVYEERGLTSV